ncbi:MAG: TIGR03936 family radical SAM-associated protein [Oscillospiraceae bacterium]|nr:TIGR03936 family radical SAM-associated protein [Oscillospiraceae bacterium]
MQRNIRIFFEKTGRAKYISHLDMTRCWTRTFNRAGLPMWYTEGFNPHLYMTFALPLSLGFEGLCESFDARLIADIPLDEVKERLNQVLPTGLQISRVADQKMNAREIKWADYELCLECENPKSVHEKLTEFLNRDSIVVEKRTKKGVKDMELNGLYTVLESSFDETSVLLKLRLATGVETNVNPMLLLENSPVYAEILQTSVRRTAVLTADLNNFE